MSSSAPAGASSGGGGSTCSAGSLVRFAAPPRKITRSARTSVDQRWTPWRSVHDRVAEPTTDQDLTSRVQVLRAGSCGTAPDHNPVPLRALLRLLSLDER